MLTGIYTKRESKEIIRNEVVPKGIEHGLQELI